MCSARLYKLCTYVKFVFYLKIKICRVHVNDNTSNSDHSVYHYRIFFTFSIHMVSILVAHVYIKTLDE